MARSSAAVLAYLSKTDVELAITFTKIHEMNFRLAGIPIDYPYGGPIDLDPVAMHALFEYGERCAEQGLLWTTPPEALHRRQAGLERYESKPNPEKPTAPKDVPCPAASKDTHPPI